MVRSRAITDVTELTSIRGSALIVGKEDDLLHLVRVAEAVRLAGIPPVDLFAFPADDLFLALVGVDDLAVHRLLPGSQRAGATAGPLPFGASRLPWGSGVMSACLPGRLCDDLGEKASPEEAF